MGVLDEAYGSEGGGGVLDEAYGPPTQHHGVLDEAYGKQPTTGVLDHAYPPAQQVAQPTWGDTAVTAGLRIGTPLLGSIAGGVPGGMAGGALGDIAAQAYERSHNLRQDYSLREATAQGLIGGLPGGSLTRSGVTAGEVAKEALRSAALGVGATAIGTEGSRGELPTAKEAAFGAGLGIFGAGVGSGVERFRTGKFGPSEIPPSATTPGAAHPDLTFTRTDKPNMAKIGPTQSYDVNDGDRALGNIRLRLNNVGEGQGEGGAPASYTADLSGFKGTTNDFTRLLKTFPEEFNVTEIDQSSTPTSGGMLQGGPLSRLKNQVVGRIFPESVSEGAGQAQETFSPSLAAGRTKTFGLLANKDWQANVDAMDKLSPQQQIDFAIQASQGSKFPNDPALAKVADLYRQATNPRGESLLNALPEGKIGYRADYFAPMFTDPQAAEKAFTREMAEGYPTLPSFTKEKTLTLPESLEFAQKYGLQLKTTNPLRWAEQRLGVEDRYVGLIDAAKNLDTAGKIAQWPGDMRSLPTGIAPLDPRVGMALGKDNLVAEEPIAKIINNKFAPDSLGPYMRGASTLSSLANQTRVAIDLYHAGRTIISDIGNNVGEAIGLGLKGELSAAMKAAVAPPRTAQNYRLGRQTISEFGNAGVAGENVTPAMQMAIRGGLTPEPDLANSLTRNFSEQMKDSEHYLPTNVVRGVTSVLSAPVMRNVVPAIKMGAFQQAMDHFVTLNPNATEAELVSGAQSIRRNLDNVFGHISADNLGMSKTAANALRVFIGFPSWNLGKVRLASDVVGGTRQVLSNESLSSDQAQALRFAGGTIITHMMAAALLNRALSGEWPTEATDFFAPRTGGKLDDGNDERLYLPTVGTDAYKMFHNPSGTIGAKSNPLVASAYDLMVRNTDAMGIRIRDPQANGFVQTAQVGKYLGKQATPFAVQSLMGGGVPPSSLGPAAQLIGLTRAPASLSRDPAEQAIADAESAQLQSRGGITQEEADRQQARRALRTQLRANPTDTTLLPGAIQGGIVNQGEQKRFAKNARGDQFVSKASMLGAEDFVRVWQQANPEERQKLQAVAKKKMVRARVMGNLRDLQVYQAAGIR